MEKQMLTRSAFLKKLTEQKKLITAKQKVLRQEENENKEERITLKANRAAIRKEIVAQQKELRELVADIKPVLKSGNFKKLDYLQLDIDKTSDALVKNLIDFAKLQIDLAELAQ